MSHDRTTELRKSACKKAREGAWLTVPEAAAVLGISEKMAYDQAGRGELKSRKIGSRRLIDPNEVVPVPRAPAAQEDRDRQETSLNIALLLANIDHAMTILQQARAALQEAK